MQPNQSQYFVFLKIDLILSLNLQKQICSMIFLPNIFVLTKFLLLRCIFVWSKELAGPVRGVGQNLFYRTKEGKFRISIGSFIWLAVRKLHILLFLMSYFKENAYMIQGPTIGIHRLRMYAYFCWPTNDFEHALTHTLIFSI